MTVSELIEKLQQYNGSLEVIVPAAGSVEMYRLDVVELECYAENEEDEYFYRIDPEEYAEGDDDRLRRVCLWRS